MSILQSCDCLLHRNNNLDSSLVSIPPLLHETLGCVIGRSPNIITRLTTQPLKNVDCIEHLSSATHVPTSGLLKPTVDHLAKRPDRTL